MRFVPALLLDAVFVLVFAVIGRASHDESPAGFLVTAWPFLVALLVGHLVAAALPARPRRPWSVLWGAVVWVVTVLGGILLRLASGDTAEVPFIIVTTLVLGAFLLGWRVSAALLRRRAARAKTETAVDSDAPAADSDVPAADDDDDLASSDGGSDADSPRG